MHRSTRQQLQRTLDRIPGLRQWIDLSRDVYRADEILHDRPKKSRRTA